jgi:hypothetical protein
MASATKDEIEADYETFEEQWPKDMAAARAVNAKQKKVFVESYCRIATIQTWRIHVIQGACDEDSEAFFFEAQNDLLVSHCLAQSGSFRQALKALRSFIENVFFALYYMDHRVELKKWEAGQHKATFTELHNYFLGHPGLEGANVRDTGLDALKEEYSTLSKAVHGSAKKFRMTKDLADVQIWMSDQPLVGMWATREKSVVVSVNLLLAHLFRTKLTGAQLKGVREVLGVVMPPKRRQYLKSKLKINLIT